MVSIKLQNRVGPEDPGLEAGLVDSGQGLCRKAHPTSRSRSEAVGRTGLQSREQHCSDGTGWD